MELSSENAGKYASVTNKKQEFSKQIKLQNSK